MASRAETAAKASRLILAAESLVAEGKVTEAIAAYKQMLEVSPDDERILQRVASLYDPLRDKRNLIAILVRLAAAYEKHGALTKAVAAYKRVVRLDRARIATYEELARLYEGLLLFAEAAEQWNVLAAHSLGVGDLRAAAHYKKRVQRIQSQWRLPPRPGDRASIESVRPADGLPIQGIEVISVPVDMLVFLCHASEDKQQVRELYQRLLHDHVHPWLDEEDLLPGQNWRVEISKAVRRSHAVAVCLSERSTTKAGYLQKELKIALDILDEQPEGMIFVIPVRLEPCAVPDALQHLHYVDLFTDHGYNRLLRAIHARAEQLGLRGAGRPNTSQERTGG